MSTTPQESHSWSESISAVKYALKAFSVCVYRGFADSANLGLFARYFVNNASIRFLLINCFAVNFILLLSLYLISELVGPLAPTGAFAVVIAFLFGSVWVVPMYVVTQLLGVAWYEKLYDAAVQEQSKRRKQRPPPPRPFSFVGVSEVLLKSFVTLLFGIVAALVAFVPLRIGIGMISIAVGPLCSLTMGCWLNSVYCFDYRFNQLGRVNARTGLLEPVSLANSLKFFEKKWAYYLGFSLWHIAVRTIMEETGVFLFGRLAVCSALFAVNVVLSVDAKPSVPGDTALPSLPIFIPYYRVVCVMLHKKATKSATVSVGTPTASSAMTPTQPTVNSPTTSTSPLEPHQHHTPITPVVPTAKNATQSTVRSSDADCVDATVGGDTVRPSPRALSSSGSPVTEEKTPLDESLTAENGTHSGGGRPLHGNTSNDRFSKMFDEEYVLVD